MLDLIRWPVALAQGIALRFSVPVLEPPSDAAPELVGDPRKHPPLKLFCLGESTVVGCGARRMRDTLPVQFATHLADQHEIAVHWRQRGRYGARAADCLSWLQQPHSPAMDHDLALVVLGVNDTLRLTSQARWTEQMERIIQQLSREGQAKVVVAGVPPMHLFPALRGPIRTLLGRRARALDDALQGLVDGRQRVHVPMPDLLQLEADAQRLFAEDRFHPSALGYRYWAEHLAGQLRALR